MSGVGKNRNDNRRPTFRDHRTPQFGGGRRLQNPAHYPRRRTISPIRRGSFAVSPLRQQPDPRERSPNREHRRSNEKESKEAVVTSTSTALSSGTTRAATSGSVVLSSASRRNEYFDRRKESAREDKYQENKNIGKRRESTERPDRSANIAARIQAPTISPVSPSHHFQRQHQNYRNDRALKRTVDSRPMSYGASSAKSHRQISGDRPTSRNRYNFSSDSSRRHEKDGEKERKLSQRENDKKNHEKSSGRRRDDEKKARNDASRREKKEENPKSEKRVVDETREEDEAVARQGLEEVDCCEGDESTDQNLKQDGDAPKRPVTSQSNHSGDTSNTSPHSDCEEELDYEEDDIDIDLDEDIDVETMKLAARGDLKVDDTTDEDEMDENEEVHEMKKDNEDEEKKKRKVYGEPEKKRAKPGEKEEERKRFHGSTSSISRRGDSKEISSSVSDRKEHRRSGSPARRREAKHTESRTTEGTSKSERSSNAGGAGTEIQRIPSLLTMRIAAPPGIKKLENFYHSSGGSSSSHSSEGVGETFSNRWCQCSCAHHMPSTSSAGSLDASPASSSSSSSGSDASVSRIPSLMSLRTPFNNCCLFLAPPPRRSHDVAARIKAPSPPRRPFPDRGFQRNEDHRGGRHVDGMKRRRSPDRERRNERNLNDFEDRKRTDRGFTEASGFQRRSPLRRRPSPPRGRPGEKVVRSYRNGL